MAKFCDILTINNRLFLKALSEHFPIFFGPHSPILIQTQQRPKSVIKIAVLTNLLYFEAIVRGVRGRVSIWNARKPCLEFREISRLRHISRVGLPELLHIPPPESSSGLYVPSATQISFPLTLVSASASCRYL